jgi:hypothetical protein
VDGALSPAFAGGRVRSLAGSAPSERGSRSGSSNAARYPLSSARFHLPRISRRLFSATTGYSVVLVEVVSDPPCTRSTRAGWTHSRQDRRPRPRWDRQRRARGLSWTGAASVEAGALVGALEDFVKVVSPLTSRGHRYSKGSQIFDGGPEAAPRWGVWALVPIPRGLRIRARSPRPQENPA